jgi:hypothetical protein
MFMTCLCGFGVFVMLVTYLCGSGVYLMLVTYLCGLGVFLDVGGVSVWSRWFGSGFGDVHDCVVLVCFRF